MADNQFLTGYCLLLASPLVGQFLDLPEEGQSKFLSDMARVGAAVKEATGCLRVNFAIYGNVDPFLHAHIWPRFSDEALELRTMPPLLMPESFRTAPETVWSAERYGELLSRLSELLV